jgi:heterodisulfide reductase subunit A-like polyferredoxin
MNKGTQKKTSATQNNNNSNEEASGSSKHEKKGHACIRCKAGKKRCKFNGVTFYGAHPETNLLLCS